MELCRDILSLFNLLYIQLYGAKNTQIYISIHIYFKLEIIDLEDSLIWKIDWFELKYGFQSILFFKKI